MRYSSLLLLAIAGCAGGKTIETQPPTRRLSEFKDIRILTTASEPSGRFMLSFFSPAVTAEVRSRGIFTSCRPSDDGDGDLLLSAKITSAAGPHNVGTSMGGSWRGAGKLTVECSLDDIKTGQLIGTFTVSAKSGAIGAGGDDGARSAADQAAARIADYIEKYK